MTIDKDSLYIQELKKDSHKAFEYLYDRYADHLYGFVLLHTRSSLMAEEIVQDTYMKIWSNRYRLSVEGSFKSFLFTIAKNKIIDTFRSQITKVDFLEFVEHYMEEQKEHNPVEANMYFEDFREKLNEAKKTLPEKQRLVFELNREKGMAIKAIAEKFNLSEQTVKNQLTSALKILRKKLRSYHCLFFLYL